MQGKDTFNALCVSCLCIGRTLKKLSESLFKFYMDALYEIPLSNMSGIEPAVCWECEALLKRCLSFREQVKDSYRILQTYTVENLHECLLSDVSRPPRLKMHINDTIDILPHEEIKIEFDKDYNKKNSNGNSSDTDDMNTDEIQTVLCDLKNEYTSLEIEEKDCLSFKQCTEIKNELENDDDVTKYVQNDISINEVIVKEKSKKNSLNRIRIKEEKRRKIKHKTKDDKIKQIQLSYDEMMKERLGLAQRESFMNSPHKCESCILSFTTASALTTHMSSKHTDDLVSSYQCPICKTIMNSVEAFTAHYKRHTRRYECTVCQKRGVDIKTLQRHYETTHNRCLKEYKRGVRGKLTRLEKNSHDTEIQKKRVQCNECEKTFSHRAGLMNHRISVHEAQNEFPCKLCKKVFRWKTSLKRHLEKHASNTQTPEAFCSTCGIGFGSVASLQRHLRNSLKHVTPDQLKYICDHCKRRFADKTKLRDHIEDKHLNRTYKCYICDKPSKNRVGLEQHIRNVHKGRPNNKMCHHCGKGFPTKVQLESHIRTHTGERPFICEYCPTTFSQQSNLYKHHRQVHQSIRMKKKKLPSLKKNDGPLETNPEEPSLPIAVIQYMALPDSMFAV